MSTILRRHSRRRARGFTLTELMVSLVMGLIVALAAVALSRTATTTFHEQARSSQTEMAVRTAVERLKLDLARTSYMSTGNIALDPKVSRFANANTGALIGRYGPLATLRGISITPGMGGVPAGIAGNGLNPDSVDLVGNFTTDDAYTGVITTGTGGISGAGCGSPQAITLDPLADAATWQLGGGTGSSAYTDAQLLANAKTAFLPVAAQPMLAQVTDAIGCNNYVPVCGLDVSSHKLVILVDGNGSGYSRAVLYSNGGDFEAGNGGLLGGCGSSENGKVTIAPLQHVKWSLARTPTALQATLDNDPTDPTNTNDPKYNLTRQVYDFSGTAVGNPEIIAEYAVDLKFGIEYDNPLQAGAARQTFDELDTDNATGDIYATTNIASTTTVSSGQPGPQRVRSVKFRVAVRTALADRDSNLPSGSPKYLARYCINYTAAGSLGACTKWARVRTVVSEASLNNQARMTY